MKMQYPSSSFEPTLPELLMRNIGTLEHYTDTLSSPTLLTYSLLTSPLSRSYLAHLHVALAIFHMSLISRFQSPPHASPPCSNHSPTTSATACTPRPSSIAR